jgi:hypothetical protein
MEILEMNLGTMQKLSENLKQHQGSFGQFDGIIYELIEEGLLEPQAGKFTRDIWDGKEVLECEDCREFKTGIDQREDCGLLLCPECFALEN